MTRLKEALERDPLLTPQEVAAMLAVNVKTLATWRRDGRGPKRLKVGGLVRYRESAVAAWLETVQRESAARMSR